MYKAPISLVKLAERPLQGDPVVLSHRCVAKGDVNSSSEATDYTEHLLIGLCKNIQKLEIWIYCMLGCIYNAGAVITSTMTSLVLPKTFRRVDIPPIHKTIFW
jgi:hypothetical protein